MKIHFMLITFTMFLIFSSINFAQENGQKDKSENKIFTEVEKMPAPIGGIKAIQEKIHYPEQAKKDGIEGIVYIKTLIDENGEVEKTELMKTIGGGCDEEAVKAVKQTKFSPGKHNDKLVKVQIVVPIQFKLK